jgi:MerR family transcriptional regulator, copper efflux regulator
MRIGALARATSVSTRTLRHYEAQGLIVSRRGPNGYRDFDPATLEQVHWIRDLLDCGFSTRQIVGMMDCLRGGYDADSCAAGLALHRRKLDELDALIGVLSERRERLRSRIAHFGATPPVNHRVEKP